MNKAAYTIEPGDLALFTDLYELTMLQSYFDAGLEAEAEFSLFVRRLPEERNYLLACGLSDVLDHLEALRFSPEALDYLRSLEKFSDSFLDWLTSFRFRGDVFAVPEGTPVFANEPLLEVAAPLPQAQLVETLVMNQTHLQTLLASKAARVVEAAQGRMVVDFGVRRVHGFDAGLRSARAYHVAGVDATSFVLGGQRYGVPVAGTMAHSYVQAFAREIDAFRAFVKSYPDTVLLVDTYDTVAGVKNVIELARELGEDFRVRAVRLDSGDLAALAKQSRALLDQAGLHDVGIFASGGLDEYEIAGLVRAGAPISGFGVGTAMGVSKDAPALDIAYKLTSYGGEGRLKLSAAKQTLPGAKQVFRNEEGGRAVRDVIARRDERLPGRPLLRKVMDQGRRLPDVPRDLDAIREHARAEIDKLPAPIRGIAPAPVPYPVEIGPALQAYARDLAAKWG